MPKKNEELTVNPKKHTRIYKFARTQRDIEIYDAWITHGLTIEQLSQKFDIAPANIKKRLDVMITKLTDERLRNLSREREKAITRHEHIYHEAINEWDKSKSRVESRSRLRVKGAQDSVDAEGNPVQQDTMRELTESTKLGDPRYLTAATNAVDRVVDILGLKAPQRVPVDSQGNDVVPIVINNTANLNAPISEDNQLMITQMLEVMNELGLTTKDLERNDGGSSEGEDDEAAIDAEFRSVESSGEPPSDQTSIVLSSQAVA